jgi:hypothetical protein
VRPSAAVNQPVSSTLSTPDASTFATSNWCGSANTAEARWQIASTVPVERRSPNRSRASSDMSRRETRLRAVNVTTAACKPGPNAEPATEVGNAADVFCLQPGQHNLCVRCSKTITAIGGSSAT